MARPKLGDSETERLHMKISADEVLAIDDWRYANRIPSRSEAVRRLVQIGLAYDAQAADWAQLIKEAFDHAVAISREALEIGDEATVDYKTLHLRSLAHLLLFSKNASELARRMSEQARFAELLQTESDIDALVREQAELRAAIKAAKNAFVKEEQSK
jgi:hypothetical protein